MTFQIQKNILKKQPECTNKRIFENKIKQDLFNDKDYAVLNDIYEKERRKLRY